MRRSSSNGVFKLLLVTDRAGVLAFFERAATSRMPMLIERVAVDAAADGGDANAAVVDMGDADQAALAAVSTLLAERPELPVGALMCCPHCVEPETLRKLIASGVGGLLDLRSTPAEASRLLAALADGDSVLRLHFAGSRQAVLRDLMAARPPLGDVQAQILALVAHGFRDREIGERLHLSPHTVKHRVEQLRRAVRARNRIELAAWAGRNGFYRETRD
jgi:DNA-binding NarL/FixJ family response regulator